MSSSALTSKDVNASVAATGPQDPKAAASADVKSMEYHRQVLQSKIDNQSEYASPLPPLPHASHQQLTRQPTARTKQYISPSDNIQSPCTAKLSAFRNKQVGKYVLSPSPVPPCHGIVLTMTENRAKPKSLFARASHKKIEGAAAGGDGLFGSAPAPGAKGVDENAN